MLDKGFIQCGVLKKTLDKGSAQCGALKKTLDKGSAQCRVLKKTLDKGSAYVELLIKPFGQGFTRCTLFNNARDKHRFSVRRFTYSMKTGYPAIRSISI